MPKASAREHRMAADLHRRKLADLVERRGVGRLKRLYDAAQDELESKLRRLPLGSRESFTAHQHRVLLAQARQGQRVVAQKLAGGSAELSREAQVESLRGLASTIGRLESAYKGASPVLPIDEAARFFGVIDKRRTSLIRAHESSMTRWGARTATRIEEELGLSLATGETTNEAVDRVREVADTEWWRAERIVRTESAWSFNATAADGVAEIAREVDDLYLRWVEHVTDDGEPMDDRVGDDSIAMHGQVTRPGGVFTMPDDPDVSDSLVGQSWSFPPNRPHDRAVIVAWRPAWGGLAWTYDGARKAYLSR